MDILRVQVLCETLEEHLVRYQQLVDFIATEKKLLLELDLDGLFEASKIKESLGLDIQKHIGLLINAISDVAYMLGLGEREILPTLSELAALVPKPFDNKLNDGAIKLAQLKNIILRENEANRHFVQEALKMVNESINILTGANQLKGDGYQKDGKKGQAPHGRPIKFSREV